MGKNSNFHIAKKQKNDEFYTQLSDIENELRHYKQHFRGKVVFCNCDDPYESNFFKYFAMNFNSLGLKKLIATGYVTSSVAGKELSLFEEEVGVPKNQPYVAYINEVGDYNGDGRVDLSDVKLLLRMKKNTRRKLHGDEKFPAGDFRSEESLALLKQADVVVTNPPFSLFREYVAQLIEYNKDFVIIGNINAITNKKFFPYIQEGKIHLGYGGNIAMTFKMRDSYEVRGNSWIGEDGCKYTKMGSCAWFTNLDIPKIHEKLILYKPYSPNEYPKYVNYDAINIDRVADIPYDYNGVMGVPVSFMNKFCPDQFEIVGFDQTSRIPIQNCGLPKGSYTPSGSRLYIKKNDNFYKMCYARILIKRKSAIS